MIITKTSKRVKCAECKYAQIDEEAPGNGPVWLKNKKVGAKRRIIWTGIECTNPDSDYYKALLNVGFNGNRQEHVTWPGCEYGRRVDV